MFKKLCLIAALLLFTQASFADDAPVILKVNNSSQHMVEVREGWIFTKVRLLQPVVGSLTHYKWFGHISGLKISYIDDDEQVQLVESCPKGFFLYSLTVDVREDESRGVYCYFLN